MDNEIMTIARFILEQERHYPEATGALSGLLQNISFATKIISREVTKAGLIEILGTTGSVNVQGEEVQKLDEYANNTLYQVLNHCGHLCVMATEEDENILPIPEPYECGKYVGLFDPLDGSSNIDANVSIGTIFSFHRKKTEGKHGTIEDCLRAGTEQVCAGYVIYGSSTMMVYTTGQGVHGFTLDPSIGEFLLSHKDIKIPAKGQIFSANMQNYKYWHEGTQKYIDYVMDIDKPTNRPYSLRYIGSLVADFHRNLLYGGIFLYPEDTKNPKKPHGKLRLLYEAAPMGFIIEQAGGYASTGTERILDIQAEQLHQRVPLIIGSLEDVKLYEEFRQGKR